MDKPLKSVMHGQCDARPTVTFPVAGHRCPSTGTKLYCLVKDAHVCKQLGQGRYRAAEQPGVELATFRVASRRLNHYTTRLHMLCRYLIGFVLGIALGLVTRVLVSNTGI